MTKKEYLRLRLAWRRKRDEVMRELLSVQPDLSEEKARSTADKIMGYSVRELAHQKGK